MPPTLTRTILKRVANVLILRTLTADEHGESETSEMSGQLENTTAAADATASDHGESEVVDYTILNVAVMTLSLILFLQLFRHKLELFSIRRPFLRAVVEGVFAELAILGIVEFFIYLLHRYDTGLDMVAKEIFSQVHFTLFFTALFNAIQSCILAFLISRNSQRLWVETEYQDLHHYIEIREEFEIVSKELATIVKTKGGDNDVSELGPGIHRRYSIDEMDGTSTQFQYTVSKLGDTWNRILQSARYPQISRRYQSLLVQIRFHELKVHFIQANNLPKTLRVSDYLKRCELHILIRMVHISTISWLTVTGLTSLLYFIVGALIYHTNGNALVLGYTMTGIFFGTMTIFVVISLLIWNKVNWIFHTIIHSNLISQTRSTETESENIDSERPRVGDTSTFDQLSLFWGRNTRLITVLIQFMQIGFALSLSILFVFWYDIDSKEESVETKGFYYLLYAVLCYSSFLYIMTHVVPRFTLCSSIGQLANKKRLHETLARHRLDEALRQRQQVQLEQKFKASIQSNADRKRQLSRVDSLSFLGKTAKDSRNVMDPNLLEAMVNTNTKDLRKNLASQEPTVLEKRHFLSQASSESVKTTKGKVRIAEECNENLEGNGMLRDRKRSLSASPPNKEIRNDVPKSSSEESRTIFETKEDVDSTSRTQRPSRDQRRREKIGNSGTNQHNKNSRVINASMPGTTNRKHAGGISRSTQRSHEIRDHTPSDVTLQTNLADMTKQSNLVMITNKTQTEDDDCNDIGDIHQVKGVDRQKKKDLTSSRLSMSLILYSYFRSKKYIVFSSVFGTMICFFLIGMRLEAVMIENGILEDSRTWYLKANFGYWLEVFFLLCFLFGDFLILYLFRPKKTSDRKDRHLFYSAILDVIICSTCLSLLMVSQSSSCPTEVESRYLSEGIESGGMPIKEEIDTITEKSVKSCPPFGNRTYGGFGTLEMFTSLVVFRLIRFWFVEFITNLISKAQSKNDNKNEEEVLESHDALHPLDLRHDHKGSSHTSHHEHALQEEVGTIVDLWKTAVSQHTDVVAKYGEFSGQLLQAMLGMPILGDSDDLESEDFNEDVTATTSLNNPVEQNRRKSRKSSLFTALETNGTSFLDPPDSSLDEVFASPNARLIRKMRRCDRKVLPMLDRWVTVDVVLTNYEIVYFDAADSERLDDDSSAVGKRMKEIRQAIVTTKGGKGLRLREVAFGRKVVGTIKLTDIEEIHVNRVMPHDTPHVGEEKDDLHLNEYWKDHYGSKNFDEIDLSQPRNIRWSRIKQDQLTLRTFHSTLHLRFYGDLAYFEAHTEIIMNENESTGPIFKNNALQWCQSIGRLLGTELLKQELPNLGLGTSDELRDYLTVVGHLERSVVDRLKKLVVSGGRLRESQEVERKVVDKLMTLVSHRRNSTSQELNHNLEMKVAGKFKNLVASRRVDIPLAQNSLDRNENLDGKGAERSSSLVSSHRVGDALIQSPQAIDGSIERKVMNRFKSLVSSRRVNDPLAQDFGASSSSFRRDATLELPTHISPEILYDAKKSEGQFV